MKRCKECQKRIPDQALNMISLTPPKYCSATCRKKAHRRKDHHIARAKRAGSPVIHRVDPVDVFERDNWRCAICRRPAPRELMGRDHHLAPTLDHRIPLKKRGHHTMENTRCAHSQCNYFRDKAPKNQPRWIQKTLARDNRTIHRERLQR